MEWKRIRIFIDLMLIIITAVVTVSGFYRTEQVESVVNEETPIYCVDTDEKVVSLTFDVNWAERDYLESILDILDEYNIQGTFFVMGGWINYTEANVEKVKDISNRGNEIGNHSYMHPSFAKITNEKMQEELKKTDDIIERYTGRRPKIFRFPSGEYTKQSFLHVRELGYYAIQWDVDSVDWKETSAQMEYERVMKKVKPGSILLFHNNAKYTPENLKKIIPELKKQGYTFKTVGEMIYKDNYYVDKNGIQHKNN